MAKKALGSGLETFTDGMSTILGDSPSRQKSSKEPAKKDGIQMIAIENITPDPNQPRKQFDEIELEGLALSIKAQGVLQPILVRPGAEGKYIIIAGERRWRAAGKANIHEVPALIREAGEGLTAGLALIENIQRTDLNPMEEALAYVRIKEQFGRKTADIANAVGKSRSHVANMLRLDNLPEDVKQLVRDGKLSMGHARALLGASNPSKLAKLVLEKDLSVRDTEKLASKAEGDKGSPSSSTSPSTSPAKSSGGSKDADTKSLERDLEASLGLSVAIEHSKKGGTVTLTYDTLEQLDDICRRLMGSAI